MSEELPSEEQDFLNAAKKLAAIPGYKILKTLRQTGKKNNYDFGLSMELQIKNLYDEYSDHPDHVQFIQKYWLRYVEDFLEVDYEPRNNRREEQSNTMIFKNQPKRPILSKGFFFLGKNF